MSRHLPHRLNSIHQAVSIALVYSVSATLLLSTAQAATIGKTIVTSAQHEPLVASIAVSNINAEDFVANLASSAVYQQMGLSPTASMSVRFVPTSATSGQVLINTSQPVSMPFADVVLAINDNGQRNVIPKTLLMPLGNSVPVQPSTKPSNQVIAGAQRPNLPVVSDRVSKPLTLRRGAPPPLFAQSSTQQPVIAKPSIQEPIQAQTSLPTISARTLPLQPTLQTSMTQRLRATSVQTDTSQLVKPTNAMTSQAVDNSQKSNNTAPNKTETAVSSINANNNNVTIPDTRNIIVQDNNASTGNAIDKQFDILNIQITRQIQVKNDTRSITSTPIPFINAKSDVTATGAPQNISGAGVVTEPQAVSSQDSMNAIGQSSITTLPANNNSMTSYTVQRNDNLWIISQQIAQKNNLDVQTVMAEIKAQNPDAFIEKDADLLKANAELSLPNYDVVPSQQSLQTAIAAQRQYYLQSNKSTFKTTDMKPTETPSTVNDKPVTVAKPKRSESISAANPSSQPKTTTQTLPQARFSVIAPGKDGSADGTQAKVATETGSGLSDDILASLKSSRQSTAAQAKRVKATNNTLSSYTKKLQLQNQKLAELEARLKKLRNQ